MKSKLLLVLALPLLAFSCSSDEEDDGVAGAGGTGGTGALGGAAGSGAGAGGASAGSGGASAGSGAGGSATAGASGSAGAAGAAGSDSDEAEPDAGIADAGEGADGDESDDGTMTFFVTSDGIGDGGNLGGLTGADAFCTELAVAASPDFGRRTWHAYLSTTDEDARDRIGTGPWRNQAGVIVANDLTQLHDQGAGGALDDTWPVGDLTVPLTEQGDQVANNVHDILTGTQADGTLDPDLTCEDWTSNVADDAILVRVGHSNRMGGGQDPSFSTTHTVGCSQAGTPNITQGGGRGSLYCFAVITGD
jgi:hypothetical protein